MYRPLAARRRAAAITLGCAAAVVAILAGLVFHQVNGNAVDRAAARLVARLIPSHVLELGTWLVDPPLVAGVIAGLAISAAIGRQWRVCALVLLTPAIALTLTQVVLKPLIGRVPPGFGAEIGTYAYPSGHETGLASLVCVLALLLLRSSMPTPIKAAGLVALVGVLAAAAIVMVGLSMHYLTDTIGGVGVALAVTLGLALALDAMARKLALRQRDAVEPVSEPAHVL